jgi:hypothetical protein
LRVVVGPAEQLGDGHEQKRRGRQGQKVGQQAGDVDQRHPDEGTDGGRSRDGRQPDQAAAASKLGAGEDRPGRQSAGDLVGGDGQPGRDAERGVDGEGGRQDQPVEEHVHAEGAQRRPGDAAGAGEVVAGFVAVGVLVVVGAVPVHAGQALEDVEEDEAHAQRQRGGAVPLAEHAGQDAQEGDPDHEAGRQAQHRVERAVADRPVQHRRQAGQEGDQGDGEDPAGECEHHTEATTTMFISLPLRL